MRVEQPKTGGPGCGSNNKLLAALTAAISNVSKPPNLFAYAVLKNARLEIYNGAPHGLCSTLKDKVNTELLSFIKAEVEETDVFTAGGTNTKSPQNSRSSLATNCWAHRHRQWPPGQKALAR